MHGTAGAPPALARALRAPEAAVFQARLALAPVGTSFVYDPWKQGPSLAAVACLLALVALAWLTFQLPLGWRRPAATAALSYLLLLLPGLGLVDMALLRYTPVADHLQYLALPALLAAAVALGDRLLRDHRARVAVTVLVCLALWGLAWRRAGLYANETLLWRDAVAKAPHSAYAASGLGMNLVDHGQREEGAAFLLRSLDLDGANPQAPLALYKLSLLDLDAGLTGSAVARLQRALALDPRYIDAHRLLSTVLIEAGRDGEAAPHLRAVLLHSGRSALLLGRTLARGSRANEAARILAPFFGTPAEAPARTALATALIGRGDLAGADRELQQALRLDPRLAEAYLALGFIADANGDRVKEAALLRQAVALDPTCVEAATRLEVLQRSLPGG
jgi:tetratricopeptide (TPR) repeat protein